MILEKESEQDKNKRRRLLALDIERQVGRIENALDDLKNTVRELKSENENESEPVNNGP